MDRRGERAESGGTTFVVYLPRVAAPADVAGDAAASNSAAAATATILLVEDDDSVRGLGTRALRQHGYVMLPARHGAEALKLAGTHDGPIDLLLTDVVMPGLSGPALAEQLLRSRPSLKVLYTSGYADDSEVIRSVDVTGPEFFQEPYSPESLARRVRGVLGGF
jgi:DNA-binding response OmpR family regulator